MESSSSVLEPSDGDDAAEESVSVISVRQFVAARVSEITSLTAQIGTTGSSQGRVKGFSFQHVSKHMRRRAVSHNPKRLPARLRLTHLSQLKKSSGGLMKKPKRPRRKYRKRSDGDILEYNRRQLVNLKWLESHIWHAKRFHMKSLWNRKLAIAPTAKCFRSLFRAARNNVIMQDISYLTPLELSGPLTILTEGMTKLIPNGFSKSPNHSRELLGHAVSPSTSTYLGPIKYIWIPSVEGSPSHPKLLLWMHPTIQSHIVEELKKGFELTERPFVQPAWPAFPNKDEQKHLWKLVSNLCWWNEGTQVTLKELNGSFNRIRLVGSKTLTVLKEVLKVGRLSLDGAEEKEEEDKGLLEHQESIWKSVDKIVNVPDSTVISLNVVDPRLELPKKRHSVKQETTEESSGDTFPFHVQWPELKHDSPLWREDMRKLILRNKTSDQQLAQARGENLIPGTAINDGKPPDVIPIALVVRSRNSAFTGVDLILPCGWLMPFWIALSYRCVRSFALEFNDYLTFEEDPYLLDLTTSRLLSPDSIIYTQENQKTDQEAKAKYFSYPPAKRQNLIKLGCAFPFSTNWLSFIHHSTSQTVEAIHVVRSREHIQILATCLRDLNPNHPIFTEMSSHLFPVQVVLLSGAVEKGACICLPTPQDFSLLVSKKHTEVPILQQPMKDTNEHKRAELSRLHHKRLSHLRKKRKVARRAALEPNKDFDLKSRLEELDSRSEVAKYNEQMNNLWLNDDNVSEVLSKQDRAVIGFTEYAHYSFVRGKSAATGYVTLGQLKRLLELHQENVPKGKRSLHVLVRNWASSLTYRWAKLDYPRNV